MNPELFYEINQKLQKEFNIYNLKPENPTIQLVSLNRILSEEDFKDIPKYKLLCSCGHVEIVAVGSTDCLKRCPACNKEYPISRGV